MTIAMTKTVTLGQMATAINVSRDVLLNWERRGHLDLIDDHEKGETRLFDQYDVAFVAVFAVLAAHEGASDADAIMRKVMKQRSYWRELVESAINDLEEVYIFVKRYRFKGIAELDAMPFRERHGNLRRELANFRNPVRAGRQVNDEDDSQERRELDPVGIFLVASAIKSAVSSQ